MKEAILPQSIEDTIQAIKATEIMLARLRPQKSTSAEMIEDWYMAQHLLDDKFSWDIIYILNGTSDGLRISKNLLRHMEHTTIEKYKAMLAFDNWLQEGHKVVDNNKDRIMHDWAVSCNFLYRYLNSTSPVQHENSVEEYFERACMVDKEKIKNSKAYYLSLTFKGRDAEGKENYHAASEFVDNFYNTDLIMPALQGDEGCQNEIKSLLLPNDPSKHFEIHAMANMVEVNIFRIKDIVSTPK